jgi:membrane protease YdiL (CAAX protease family)
MATREISGGGGLVGLIRRQQVVAFVILAYALSWWAWVWYHLDPENVGAPVLPMGPLLAALILLPIIGGWPALKDLFRRIALWRVGWVWYLVVLAGPVVVALAAVRINVMLGAQPLESFQMPDAAGLAARFVFIFLWIGLGEEPGWRGFVLPRLLLGRSAVSAALILGLIHAVWHLPLVGVEYFAWNLAPWAISVFCFSIVVTWIFRHTGGSVLMPMLMHASNNTVAVVWRMFEGADQARLWWVWVGLWVVATVAIILACGKDLTLGKDGATPPDHV